MVLVVSSVWPKMVSVLGVQEERQPWGESQVQGTGRSAHPGYVVGGPTLFDDWPARALAGKERAHWHSWAPKLWDVAPG